MKKPPAYRRPPTPQTRVESTMFHQLKALGFENHEAASTVVGLRGHDIVENSIRDISPGVFERTQVTKNDMKHLWAIGLLFTTGIISDEKLHESWQSYLDKGYIEVAPGILRHPNGTEVTR